jgi:hypothetical protein
MFSFNAYIGAVSERTYMDSGGLIAFQDPGIWSWDSGAHPKQPHLYMWYNQKKLPIEGRYKANQAYKFYVFTHRWFDKNLEIYQVDGLMTTEEAARAKEEAARAREEAARAKEEAEAVAKAERIKALDEQAKSLTKGYIYHGVNEDEQNTRLFDGGALEDGHAYYISGFMVAGGGSTAGVTTQTFLGRLGDPQNYHMVEYVSQKVKGEVVSAGQTIFGTLPVTVVVAGGKSPLHIPVVLGLVE